MLLMFCSLENSGDAKIFQRTISANDDDNEEEICLTEEEIGLSLSILHYVL